MQSAPPASWAAARPRATGALWASRSCLPCVAGTGALGWAAAATFAGSGTGLVRNLSAHCSAPALPSNQSVQGVPHVPHGILHGPGPGQPAGLARRQRLHRGLAYTAQQVGHVLPVLPNGWSGAQRVGSALPVLPTGERGGGGAAATPAAAPCGWHHLGSSLTPTSWHISHLLLPPRRTCLPLQDQPVGPRGRGAAHVLPGGQGLACCMIGRGLAQATLLARQAGMAAAQGRPGCSVLVERVHVVVEGAHAQATNCPPSDFGAAPADVQDHEHIKEGAWQAAEPLDGSRGTALPSGMTAGVWVAKRS